MDTKKEWSIRQGTLADVDQIVELLHQLHEAVSDRFSLEPGAFRENCLHLLSGGRAHFWVAEEDGRLVGCLNFTVRRTLLHPGGSALIDELVVDEGHRGTGVGRGLVLEAEKMARALGCSEVEVSTEITNARARNFYKRLGFREIGVLLEREIGPNERGESAESPVA